VLFSLAGYVVVYALFISFGFYYIYKLLRQGPTVAATPIAGATPNRPLAFADDAASATGSRTPLKS
jgi:cytochrome d ubiquinol oxidase subunit I